MSHAFLDHFSRLDSPAHRLDARIKLLCALIFLLSAVATPPQHLLALIIHGGLLLWIAALARLPLARIGQRLALVLPFPLGAALGLPWLHGGESINWLGLSLSVPGLWLLFGATVKSLLGAAALLILMATTPMPALFAGLRQLGLPGVLVDMLALTHRYLYLLIEEAHRLRRAASARGYAPRWLPQAVIIGRLAGTLFVRSYERAERVHGAMRLRGYAGELPGTLPGRPGVTSALVLVLVVGVLSGVRLWVR